MPIWSIVLLIVLMGLCVVVGMIIGLVQLRDWRAIRAPLKHEQYISHIPLTVLTKQQKSKQKNQEMSQQMSHSVNIPKLPVHMIWVGIVRDIDVLLKRNLEHIMALSEECFTSYHVYLYENDSTDNTRLILEEYAQRYPEVLTVRCDTLHEELAVSHGAHSLTRFEKMAQFRNVYVQYLRTLSTSDTDCVAVMDWDHITGISRDSLMVIGEITEPWDMLGANSVQYVQYRFARLSFLWRHHLTYYDVLSYRDVNNCRVENHSGPVHKGAVVPKPTFDMEDDSLVPVTAAFGGLAIYKKEVFDHCQYSGYDCEHVTLNDDMLAKGYTRMFIVPQMVLFH